MKDTNSRTNLSTQATYKDVVIIGNGPSGITLSYMLSGYWPYWIPEKVATHPDELLRARLNYADCDKSLVEQDLENLADGLEGRSTNPVSLLLDSLQNPCADLGLNVPSMLQYKYHADKQIDHIVLGKGEPGGSWHRMDPNLRTLSLSTWMSLPGLDFNTWDEAHPRSAVNAENNVPRSKKLFNLKNSNANVIKGNHTTKQLVQDNSTCRQCQDLLQNQQLSNNNNEFTTLCHQCTNKKLRLNAQQENNTTNDRNEMANKVAAVNVTLNSDNTISNQIVPTQLPRRVLSIKRQASKEVQSRALVSRVAEYYKDYVNMMGLDKNFLNNTLVTSIKPVHRSDNIANKKARWIVSGLHLSGKPFTYICHNVVLANGASDLSNRLGLHGENVPCSWIKHDLPQLESALMKSLDGDRSKLKSVLVVGAGLSAADAVSICRSSGINVIHVYRNRSAGLDKMLPENVYPEYHEVHKMMKDYDNSYDLYTPLPEHTITEFLPNENKVIVQHLTTGETKCIEVSFCAILIGSRPDLRFLSNPINNMNKMKIRNKCDDTRKSESEDKAKVDTVTNAADEHYYQQYQQQQWSFLSKKITWLKNLCAKCKHLNLCEWSRINEISKKNACYQNRLKHHECIFSDCNNNNVISSDLKLLSKLADDKSTGKLCDTEGGALSEVGIGEDATKPIDCKGNPIAVDKFTNEVLRAPKGLYSMGPLVGDNFIRFIPGGALAITSSLHKEND